MKEKIKQVLHKHLFLSKESGGKADEIAEEIAKVFSSNAIVSGQVCPICSDGESVNKATARYWCGKCLHQW